MPEKLFTLRELSDYLGIKEERISDLVDQGVITAYKLGGELLRFRRDQIEAIRSEIDSRITDADRIKVSEARMRVKERIRGFGGGTDTQMKERLDDFLYFNDFYIVSAALTIVLLAVISGPCCKDRCG